MENKGLLFVPDISGFTKFVTNIELIHSRHIIQELLELLIDQNQLEFEISEVEGDAVLFYKFGEAPELSSIYEQVEKMFKAFHEHLKIYDQQRTCDCTACSSAVNLSLKIISHYGEFTGYKVKHFHNLIGKDVIIAHQLLKNDIDKHEYWLVTKDLANNNPPDDFREWMNWNQSTKQTESGEIPFYYAQLDQLKIEMISKNDI
jgi:hypothetical protein